MGKLVAATPAATIRQVSVSSMDNNVYLLTSRSSGQRILIDAAADPAAILAMIAESAGDAPADAWGGLAETQDAPGVVLVVTTHQHADHLGALAQLAARTGARTVAGREDAASIRAQTGVAADEVVGDGDTIGVEGIDLAVIGLRGHTPGSIALACAEPGQPVHLFTGDSLFPGGVGNTQGDPRRFAGLLADVTARIFGVYGEDAIVHPGHGAPTTLGAERPHLAEWAARRW